MDAGAAKELARLALPTSLQMLTDWARPLLFNLFISGNVKRSGLQGEEAALELDAVGLSIMSLNLLLFATAYGFNGAMDAYTGAAFGKGDRKEVVAILLRQLLLLAGLGVFAAVLFANAETIFLAVGVEKKLAVRAAELLMMMRWAVPGDFAYDAITRWMRNQNLNRLTAFCAVSGLSISLAVNVPLASAAHPTFGPIAALIAQNTALPVLLLASFMLSQGCIPIKDLEVNVAEVPGQLRTALAALIWTCAELWAWEIQVFEAQALGAGGAAAYTLLSSTYSLLICAVPCSVTIASTSLMAQALGQQDVRRATRVLTTAVTMAVLLVLSYALPLTAMRWGVARLLCGGVPAVAMRYAKVLPLILAMQGLDALFNTLKAWLMVRQKMVFGASATFVIYYAVGLPLGALLAFGRGWGLLGLWAGLGAAVLLGCVATGAQALKDLEKVPTELGMPLLGEEGGKGAGRFLLAAFAPGVAAIVAVLLWSA